MYLPHWGLAESLSDPQHRAKSDFVGSLEQQEAQLAWHASCCCSVILYSSSVLEGGFQISNFDLGIDHAHKSLEWNTVGNYSQVLHSPP